MDISLHNNSILRSILYKKLFVYSWYICRTVHCTQCTVLYSVLSVQCTQCTVLYTVLSVLYGTLYSVYCTVQCMYTPKHQSSNMLINDKDTPLINKSCRWLKYCHKNIQSFLEFDLFPHTTSQNSA